MSGCAEEITQAAPAALTRLGERLELSEGLLGTGTYGRVHAVVGDRERAVKVYRDWWGRAPRRQRELRLRKLEAMAAMTPPDLGEDAAAAWPEAVVALEAPAAEAEPAAGYVMPRAPEGAISLSALAWAHRGSDDAKRAGELLTDAMDALHRQGLVMGDVNARNFALDPEGRLWLFDVDGWQFRDEGGFLHFAHGATDYYTHRSVLDRISGTQPNCVDPRCPLTGMAHAPTPSCRPREPYHDRYGVNRMVEDLTGRRLRRTR